MAVVAISERNLTATMTDPFIHAIPCWRVRVWHLLPPVTFNTNDVSKEKITRMPIRTIAEAQAPARMFVRGGKVASKQDYLDVIAALNKNEKGVALIVDMDPKAWVEADGTPIKKPETVLAVALRRRFEDNGLMVTAYQSGPMQLTVRRLTPLEIKERESGNGKRKK